jgi:hypothetical protein
MMLAVGYNCSGLGPCKPRSFLRGGRGEEEERGGGRRGGGGGREVEEEEEEWEGARRRAIVHHHHHSQEKGPLEKWTLFKQGVGLVVGTFPNTVRPIKKPTKINKFHIRVGIPSYYQIWLRFWGHLGRYWVICRAVLGDL